MPALSRPFVALLATEFAFASLAPVGKVALAHVDPLVLAAVRVLFGGIILAAAMPKVRNERIERSDYAYLALLALLGVAINQVLFLVGLSKTTAINASILIATIPVFTVLLTIAFRQERATWIRTGGVAAAFVGIAILVRVESFSLGSGATVGNLLIVANSLSYSLFLLLSRPLLRKYRSTTVVLWTFLFAGLGMVPLGAARASQVTWADVPPEAWMAVAWVVLVGTVAAYVLNNYALKRLSSSTVATFIFLQPIIGAALAFVLLAETVGLREVIAGTLTVAAVIVVARSEPDRVTASDVGIPPAPRA